VFIVYPPFSFRRDTFPGLVSWGAVHADSIHGYAGTDRIGQACRVLDQVGLGPAMDMALERALSQLSLLSQTRKNWLTPKNLCPNCRNEPAAKMGLSKKLPVSTVAEGLNQLPLRPSDLHSSLASVRNLNSPFYNDTVDTTGEGELAKCSKLAGVGSSTWMRVQA